MKEEELYTIRIRCKRYVQRYLMLKFGCPVKGHPYLVNIRSDKELNAFVSRAIKSPDTTRNKWLQTFEGKKRDCEIELKISQSSFHRYGWSLEITDEVALNSILERRCKDMLIQFLTLQYLLHEDLPDAIQEFYEQCGFSERSWPSPSITKIWQRQKPKLQLNCLKEEFNEIFTKIFMHKLSLQKDILQPQLNHA